MLVDPASRSAYAAAEIASAHAGAGHIAEAFRMLNALSERAKSEEIAPELFSSICTRLGRFDDAFQHLEQAIQVKSRRILWMKVDPRWIRCARIVGLMPSSSGWGCDPATSR